MATESSSKEGCRPSTATPRTELSKRWIIGEPSVTAVESKDLAVLTCPPAMLVGSIFAAYHARSNVAPSFGSAELQATDILASERGDFGHAPHIRLRASAASCFRLWHRRSLDSVPPPQS